LWCFLRNKKKIKIKKRKKKKKMALPRINIGQKIPSVAVKMMGAEGMVDVKLTELFAKKKAILFAVPGAFTPTCSNNHLPKFVQHAEEIRKQNSIDLIACISVNDAFVMSAWGEQQNAGKAGILMLADGNGDFTKQIGLLKDATGFGMGWRSHRYAMVLEDNEVKYLGVDDQKGQLEHSAAERFLKSSNL
jgi:glutaredoxin/glutathione-dependent peroxiredoxin